LLDRLLFAVDGVFQAKVLFAVDVSHFNRPPQRKQ